MSLVRLCACFTSRGIHVFNLSALWAIYNTVRYFIAYAVYSSMDGQTFALALGCTTAISFAFFICDGILAALQTRLVAAHASIRFVLNLRLVFLYLASFFIFSASIVNLVVTIIWRGTRSAELSADHRCHLDVDVVWSVYPPKATCQSSNRKVWIGLATLRVALTLLLAVSHTFEFYLLCPLTRSLDRLPYFSRPLGTI